ERRAAAARTGRAGRAVPRQGRAARPLPPGRGRLRPCLPRQARRVRGLPGAGRAGPARGRRRPGAPAAAGAHARHVRVHDGPLPPPPGGVGRAEGAAMRPLLITVGSRGDVQPYLALACGLLAAGHRPLLAAPRRFAPMAAARGVEFAPLDDELLTLQDSVKGQGVRAAITAARSVRPMLRRLLDDQAGLAARPEFDVVVHHPKALGGPSVAEKLGVPALAGLLLPLYVPTAAFAAPILPVRVPPALNRASWRITAAIEAPYRKTLRTWRRERLGLTGPVPPATRGGVLHAWSPHLLPAPADWPEEARPIG